MRHHIRSLPDPLVLGEWYTLGAGPGYQKVDGLTAVDPRNFAGERVGVFLVAGQSHTASYADGPYTIVNGAKLDMLNPYTGGVYNTVEPVLGANVGPNPGTSGGPYYENRNLFVRVFDGLLSAGVYDRIIACYIGVNGTPISLWDGGVLSNRIPIALRRLQSVGLVPTAILWAQGESDGAINTPYDTYRTSLLRVLSQPLSYGVDCKVFVQRSSRLASFTYPYIITAQESVVDLVRVFPGPTLDDLEGVTYRNPINLSHFNNLGANIAASRWQTVLTEVLSD